MITLTIVRHGESEDNLRRIWAGWQDAPLSAHARALGKSFEDTKLHAIYASPLKRAHSTSYEIHSQNKPGVPLTISPLLREQHFGEAEGELYALDPAQGKWYREPGRSFAFEGGETLDDVRARANEAVAQFIEPVLVDAYGQPASSRHIVVVAHGIFNSEILGAILARREEGLDANWGYRGMTNTGWTRLEVAYADEHEQVADGSPTPKELVTRTPTPLLKVRTTHADIVTHLEGVVREVGAAQPPPPVDVQAMRARAAMSGAAV